MANHNYIFRNVGRQTLCALALLAFGFASHAQQQRVAGEIRPGELQVRLTQYKVIKGDDGKDKLVAAERARPGEVIEYRATYANTSKSGVKDLDATLPIPAGMKFVAGTAQPADLLASLDGRTFEPTPIKRKVKLPSGATEEREVPASEYKALRWRVAMLAGGKSTVVAARMQLEAAGATVAEAPK